MLDGFQIDRIVRYLVTQKGEIDEPSLMSFKQLKFTCFGSFLVQLTKRQKLESVLFLFVHLISVVFL